MGRGRARRAATRRACGPASTSVSLCEGIPPPPGSRGRARWGSRHAIASLCQSHFPGRCRLQAPRVRGRVGYRRDGDEEEGCHWTQQQARPGTCGGRGRSLGESSSRVESEAVPPSMLARGRAGAGSLAAVEAATDCAAQEGRGSRPPRGDWADKNPACKGVRDGTDFQMAGRQSPPGLSLAPAAP